MALTPGQRRAALAMTEAELQRRVHNMCRAHGLTVDHCGDARRHWVGGMPDLFIIGRTGVLWRELKRQAEEPTPAQRRIGRLLARTGQDWAVWRPSDLMDGTITSQLACLM